MNVVFLPFFITSLLVKNLVTFSKMFLEGFGFPVACSLLLVTNAYLGYSLYITSDMSTKTSLQLAVSERALIQQREFWQKIAKETPGHRQAQEIQKTLAE